MTATEVKCRFCGRPLHGKRSVERGAGPRCLRKAEASHEALERLGNRPLFQDRIGTTESCLSQRKQ